MRYDATKKECDDGDVDDFYYFEICAARLLFDNNLDDV